MESGDGGGGVRRAGEERGSNEGGKERLNDQTVEQRLVRIVHTCCTGIAMPDEDPHWVGASLSIVLVCTAINQQISGIIYTVQNFRKEEPRLFKDPPYCIIANRGRSFTSSHHRNRRHLDRHNNF